MRVLRNIVSLCSGVVIDHLSERLEELGRQFFRGTLDQAAAQLRELTANRCFGLITQDRLVWTIRQSA